MQYKFPKIEHINDVLPAIEGIKEIIVTEKDDGTTVICYVLNTPEVFPDINIDEHGNYLTQQDLYAAIRRECRGIAFDTKSGKIIRRSLPKFFNCGERTETLPDRINLSNPHTIYEKLDGSMIAPMQLEHGIRWGTKRGITDVSFGPEEFVADKLNYQQFADYCINTLKATPIFEWCSNRNRIILSYPVDSLVLLAVRDMVSGKYYTNEQLHEFAIDFDIPLCPQFDSESDIKQVLNRIQQEQNYEGIIIQFDTGHHVKVKTDWYVFLHKARDSITREYELVQMILDEKVDDIKAHLTDEYKQKVEEYEANFWKYLKITSQIYFDELEFLKQKCNSDRKTFALNYTNEKIMHPMKKSLYFAAWEDSNKMFDNILALVKKKATSNINLDQIKILWGNPTWNIWIDT